jgi:hypothetical protein
MRPAMSIRRAGGASKGRAHLTVAFHESVLTQRELLGILRQAGYRAQSVSVDRGGSGCRSRRIAIRCRDRRDAVRLAARLDRVTGVAVASVESVSNCH